MSEYTIFPIVPSDRRGNIQMDELLHAEGIRRDANLDYSCGMYDEEMNMIATGSCFRNTLRCMAVSSAHQGEGLMNEIVTHLVEVQFERGNTHLFLYTKCSSSEFFKSLGFYEIVHINDQIVFMENRKNGFSSYLNTLKKETESFSSCYEREKVAALVMNANPFTLGHLYLVEKAAYENELVHLFIVSEDASLVPFDVRKKLVIEGTSHLKNICYHESGSYIISSATFPSYFQRDREMVIRSHALLDLSIFIKIADSLGIGRRYVGEEPVSIVTGIYNQIMSEELPAHNIACTTVPRKCEDNRIISASAVRQALKNNDFTALEKLVPQTTLDYFKSQEAVYVLKKIQKEKNVIHY